MKKKIILILLLVLFITGCNVTTNSVENIIIYTSTYPIEYITEKLYSNHARIFSIYPNEIIELSDALLEDYSKSNMFVYNGLSNEKNYAVKMLNKNKKLMIIDAAMGMNYNNKLEELWINPSNFLVLAQNIRSGFKEYVKASYLLNEIDENYEKLKLEISELDADIKIMAENAEHKHLLVSSNSFKFFEKYGLTVTSLDIDDELLDKRKADALELIKNNKISYILIFKGENLNKDIESFVKNNKIEKIEFDGLTTKNEDMDYIETMNKNIEKLKKELYN